MHNIQRIFFLIFSLFFVLLSCNNTQNNKDYQMQEGDLLFQNTGTGEIDEAIKSVSATSISKNFSHVGMVMLNDGKWFVIEAIPRKGVTRTSLEDFLNRNRNEKNKPQIAIARLSEQFKKYIPKAIEYGVKRLNTPYDSVFLWDDSAYYCSELIYKMLAHQKLGKDKVPFVTHAMTFKDDTGVFLTSWVNYYKKLNHAIPEGFEGTNPNLMASSPHINFIFDYTK